MKLRIKVLILFMMALIVSALIITPAFAVIEYLNGYCGTHPCRGTITAMDYYGKTETQVMDYTYGYVYAKVKLKVFTGAGTYEYLQASGSDPNDFYYTISKAMRESDIMVKRVTGTSIVEIPGSLPSFSKSKEIILYPD